MKKFKIKNIEIELRKGYAVSQNVNLIFNSANGLLLMRTGTAKVIREYSEKLNKEEEKAYFRLLNSFTNPIIKNYIKTFNVEGWKPRQAQLSSFKRVIENKGPYKIGEIIIDKEWSKKNPKHVLHVVGMTYHLVHRELKVNKVNEKSLTKVLKKAFQFSDKNEYESMYRKVKQLRFSTSEEDFQRRMKK